MPWLELSVEIDAAAAEAFSEALLEAGAQSVSIGGPGGKRAQVSALLALDADPRSVLDEASGACGLDEVPRPALSRVADEDWVRASQAQFTPLAVGGLWIGPSWHAPAPGARAVVTLDPGLAFGTGSHATTRLVLSFLEKNIKGGERVLDYGCGSGILAIAAAKLGAGRVDAVDLDPQALAASAANANANGVSLRAVAPEALPPALYDVVVSNILAQPLIVLAPLLASRTARGGRIALSGILDSQAGEVLAAYRERFAARIALSDEGWALVEGARR